MKEPNQTDILKDMIFNGHIHDLPKNATPLEEIKAVRESLYKIYQMGFRNGAKEANATRDKLGVDFFKN